MASQQHAAHLGAACSSNEDKNGPDGSWPVKLTPVKSGQSPDVLTPMQSPARADSPCDVGAPSPVMATPTKYTGLKRPGASCVEVDLFYIPAKRTQLPSLSFDDAVAVTTSMKVGVGLPDIRATQLKNTLGSVYHDRP